MGSQFEGGDAPGANYEVPPGGAKPYIGGMDAMTDLTRRVSLLEDDMKDVKTTLVRIESKVGEMHAFMLATLPHLATKADLAGLRTDMVAGDATIRTDMSGLHTSMVSGDGAIRKDVKSDMERDFRITWGGIIAAAVGLAALMAKGFEWL